MPRTDRSQRPLSANVRQCVPAPPLVSPRGRIRSVVTENSGDPHVHSSRNDHLAGEADDRDARTIRWPWMQPMSVRREQQSRRQHSWRQSRLPTGWHNPPGESSGRHAYHASIPSWMKGINPSSQSMIQISELIMIPGLHRNGGTRLVLCRTRGVPGRQKAVPRRSRHMGLF